MPETPWFFLLTGLLGSAHCVGMCGGFVLFYTTRFPSSPPGGLHLAYHSGRLLAYGSIGAAMGLAGSFADAAAGLRGLQHASLLFGSALMLAGGAGMIGLIRFDFASAADPARNPVFRGLFRALRSLPAGLAVLPLGYLLGFVPCGLVYTMAIAAAATGSPGPGALDMFVFGLGTVPALLGFGVLSRRLTGPRRRLLNRAAGLLIVLMGIRGLARWAALSGWIAHGPLW